MMIIITVKCVRILCPIMCPSSQHNCHFFFTSVPISCCHSANYPHAISSPKWTLFPVLLFRNRCDTDDICFVRANMTWMRIQQNKTKQSKAKQSKAKQNKTNKQDNSVTSCFDLINETRSFGQFNFTCSSLKALVTPITRVLLGNRIASIKRINHLSPWNCHVRPQREYSIFLAQRHSILFCFGFVSFFSFILLCGQRALGWPRKKLSSI